MAKLQIEIPQKKIDEAAGKELAATRKDLEAAYRKITKLEAKIAEFKKERQEALAVIKTFEEVRDYMADTFNLYREYDW